MTKRGAKRPRQRFEFLVEPGARIELGPLLKASGLCDTGGEAKHRVQGGEVRVNGQVETRRGRKLVAGDRVEWKGREIVLAESAPPATPGA